MALVKRVVLMEDDPYQAEWLMEQIRNGLNADVDFRSYSSENAFLKAAQKDFSEWHPQYALFDLLVRYYSVDDLASGGAELLDFDKLPVPEEAGLRAAEELRRIVPNCKICLITVLDYEDGARPFLQKGSENFVETALNFLDT